MIDPHDIQELAAQHSLRPTVVEKDYVLGWLLAGIAQDAEISQTWVLKGGTCLKKIYFETFRFAQLSDYPTRRPSRDALAWHYEHRFKKSA